MDLQDERHDDLLIGATLGVPQLDNVANSLKDLRSSVIVKAKRKKAQKISDAGGYASLTPYQKSLISVPDYISGGHTPASGDVPGDEQTGLDIKRFLPYIIGIVLVGIIIYFISKRKK